LRAPRLACMLSLVFSPRKISPAAAVSSSISFGMAEEEGSEESPVFGHEGKCNEKRRKRANTLQLHTVNSLDADGWIHFLIQGGYCTRLVLWECSLSDKSVILALESVSNGARREVSNHGTLLMEAQILDSTVLGFASTIIWRALNRSSSPLFCMEENAFSSLEPPERKVELGRRLFKQPKPDFVYSSQSKHTQTRPQIAVGSVERSPICRGQ